MEPGPLGTKLIATQEMLGNASFNNSKRFPVVVFNSELLLAQ